MKQLRRLSYSNTVLCAIDSTHAARIVEVECPLSHKSTWWWRGGYEERERVSLLITKRHRLQSLNAFWFFVSVSRWQVCDILTSFISPIPFTSGFLHLVEKSINFQQHQPPMGHISDLFFLWEESGRDCNSFRSCNVFSTSLKIYFYAS